MTMIATDKPMISINRRRVLQIIAAGSAATLMDGGSLMAKSMERKSQGYGPDIDMNNPEVTWDKILTQAQLKTLTIVGDIIIPADETSPAASAFNIADFINEWVSAPYPTQQADKDIIVGGLLWLDQQAKQQQTRYFRNLSEDHQATIFDRLAQSVENEEVEVNQKEFFERLIYLFVGGFYTTPEGMADIGYIGNVPMAKFEGPSAEIRQKLGV
ncbi:gluconate 2-dehydrogenase subunit 3 family protein [Porticoccaceae bacterium]|nr:gluconate 2-dehydrogenase subunit 3 family protein [Porticoccaceae bacterium]